MIIVIMVITISKLFRKYLNNIPVKHVVKELQRATILVTTHISESANVEVQNIQLGKLHYSLCIL
jgi:hypothetical protein